MNNYKIYEITAKATTPIEYHSSIFYEKQSHINIDNIPVILKTDSISEISIRSD
jgi:hypothetical protein